MRKKIAEGPWSEHARKNEQVSLSYSEARTVKDILLLDLPWPWSWSSYFIGKPCSIGSATWVELLWEWDLLVVKCSVDLQAKIPSVRQAPFLAYGFIVSHFSAFPPPYHRSFAFKLVQLLPYLCFFLNFTNSWWSVNGWKVLLLRTLSCKCPGHGQVISLQKWI